MVGFLDSGDLQQDLQCFSAFMYPENGVSPKSCLRHHLVRYSSGHGEGLAKVFRRDYGPIFRSNISA